MHTSLPLLAFAAVVPRLPCAWMRPFPYSVTTAFEEQSVEACLQHPCEHWELRPTGVCQPRLQACGAFHWLDNMAAAPCHMHVATCELVTMQLTSAHTMASALPALHCGDMMSQTCCFRTAAQLAHLRRLTNKLLECCLLNVHAHAKCIPQHFRYIPHTSSCGAASRMAHSSAQLARLQRLSSKLLEYRLFNFHSHANSIPPEPTCIPQASSCGSAERFSHSSVQLARLQRLSSTQPAPVPFQLPAHSAAHINVSRDTETHLLCCVCRLHSTAIGASGGVAAQQEQTACSCAPSTSSAQCGAHKPS